VARYRHTGEEGLAIGVMRPPSCGDAFPWEGELENRDIFPGLDPDDASLHESLYRLGLAVKDSEQRLGRGSAEMQKAQDTAKDQELAEQTGRDMMAWEKYVVDLRKDGTRWDWSRIEVHEVRPEECPEEAGGYAAAFAVCTPFMDPEEPVFRAKDVLGPVGGTVYRRETFEHMFYPPGGKVGLHDPCAYIFRMKAKTPELRLQGLVIDVTSGPSANRLRYVADARDDPLRLQALLGGPGAPGVFDRPEMLLKPRMYGSEMPRPRSRPSSPSQGDGGAERRKAFEEQQAQDQSEEEDSRSEEERLEEERRRTIRDRTNAQIVEVLVQGWPYAFIVATRDINNGERVNVDRGEEYWANQRAQVARLQAIGRIGQDLCVGVDLVRGRKKPEPEPLQPQVRQPMRRLDIGK